MNTLSQDRLSEKLNTRDLLNQPRAASANVGTTASDANSYRIRNILAVLNACPSSQIALRHATELAQLFRAQITVVYSVPTGGSLVSPQDLQTQITQSADVPSTQIRATIIRRGPLSFLHIANVARIELADLIILASDFDMGQRWFFPNSAIDKLIRHAPCPVFVVSNSEPQRASPHTTMPQGVVSHEN